MIQIDNSLLDDLLSKAAKSERLRMNYDLRTSSNDGSQRMLNALLPGTVVPIHRHPMSTENVILLKGKLIEILFEEVDPLLSIPSVRKILEQADKEESDAFDRGMDAQDMPHGKRLKEVARYHLDPSVGNFGCVVPAGAWHTVEVLEPSVIYESKDGKYEEDGSESW